MERNTRILGRFWHLVTSGDLNSDLGKQMAQIVSKELRTRYWTFFLLLFATMSGSRVSMVGFLKPHPAGYRASWSPPGIGLRRVKAVSPNHQSYHHLQPHSSATAFFHVTTMSCWPSSNMSVMLLSLVGTHSGWLPRGFAPSVFPNRNRIQAWRDVQHSGLRLGTHPPTHSYIL